MIQPTCKLSHSEMLLFLSRFCRWLFYDCKLPIVYFIIQSYKQVINMWVIDFLLYFESAVFKREVYWGMKLDWIIHSRKEMWWCQCFVQVKWKIFETGSITRVYNLNLQQWFCVVLNRCLCIYKSKVTIFFHDYREDLTCDSESGNWVVIKRWSMTI